MTETTTTTTHAHNVCSACKLRKRACDKALPACDFCAKRRLLCQYHHVTAAARGERRHNPGRNFVPIQVSSSESSPSSFSSPPTTAVPATNPIRIGDPRALDQYKQAHYIIELAYLARDDISHRYFQTFHKCLPIISPERFHQAASRCRGDISKPPEPPQDFIVLLLAMWLIITPDEPSDSTLIPPLGQDVLYRATKSLLSQAQVDICVSLPLVQAVLLITICEYAAVRAKAAYISIITCIGLARVLGIKESSVGSLKNEMGDNVVGLAIVMLESVILCELDQRDLRPLTACPCPDFQPAQPQPDFQASNPSILSSLHATDVNQFQRQVQATLFLDQVLSVTRHIAEHGLATFSELAELDNKIRTFLAQVMSEDGRGDVVMTIPIAICVRSLFLLHGTILDVSETSETEVDYRTKQMSRAALDMTCQLIVDVSRHHLQRRVETMPICCYYNLRAAIECLQERNKSIGSREVSRNIECLLQSQRIYSSKWLF